MSLTSERVPIFSCTQPCGNCPYRIDAPRRHWDRSEFEKLLDGEESDLGLTYMCHKANGSICVGFLMDQLKREVPSILLRLELGDADVRQQYLDQLHSPAPLFGTVRQMIRANFPSILRGRKVVRNSYERLRRK